MGRRMRRRMGAEAPSLFRMGQGADVIDSKAAQQANQRPFERLFPYIFSKLYRFWVRPKA